MATPTGGAGQLTVAAAQTRLAELILGQTYRVEITDVFPSKVEFLLGNQYLLAATNFRFRPGDIVNLKLIERTPELLTFQLTLPTGEAAGKEADLLTLLRAANLPDSAANRAALSALVRSGINVNARTVAEMAQLLNALPVETVAAFLPLYKDLIAKGLHLAPEVLEQLARLSTGPPELSGLLATALERLKQRGSKRGLLEDAVEAALTSIEREEDLPTAGALKDKLRLLYGSPEKALGDALGKLRDEGRAPRKVELADLTNIGFGEHVPAELIAVVNMLQALRVDSSLDPRALELSLPLAFDGEPTEVHLSINLLAEQYYQKDYALRLRVENRTQGQVEFQLRTRGPGLYVDVLAEEPETIRVYEGLAEQLKSEIEEQTPFIVRRISVGAASL